MSRPTPQVENSTDDVNEAARLLIEHAKRAMEHADIQSGQPLAILLEGWQLDVASLQGVYEDYIPGGAFGPTGDLDTCHDIEFLKMKASLIYMGVKPPMRPFYDNVQAIVNLMLESEYNDIGNAACIICDPRTLADNDGATNES